SVSAPPIGSVIASASEDEPDNYKSMNGQAISRVTYSELFSLIGITYGSGDGATTFNLPNLKGKTIIGLDPGDTDFESLGLSGGAKSVALDITEMPRHNHKIKGHQSDDIGGGVNRPIMQNDLGTDK